MEDLRYPIGTFDLTHTATTPEERKQAIDAIADAPEQLRQALSGLNGKQFDTPYRDGGWSVRQVTHHLPDSHLNAYIRFKLALTEDTPLVKPYDEARWAELSDSRVTPIDVSLGLFENLHARWVVLLRGLRPEDFQRQIRHPEIGIVSLATLLPMYAWHSRHHIAHITRLRDRNHW